MNRIQTEVLVIGGGATGTGVAWDAALRGLKVVLVERRDLTHGTSGRYHGLLAGMPSKIHTARQSVLPRIKYCVLRMPTALKTRAAFLWFCLKTKANILTNLRLAVKQ